VIAIFMIFQRIGNYKHISIAIQIIFVVSIKSFDRIYRIGSYPANPVNPV